MNTQTPNPQSESARQSWKKSTPESKSVKSVEYRADLKMLTVEFKYGTYDYKNVPLEVGLAAKNAASIGSFVHSDLKDKFETDKRP